jgi:hypothetical protein
VKIEILDEAATKDVSGMTSHADLWRKELYARQKK